MSFSSKISKKNSGAVLLGTFMVPAAFSAVSQSTSAAGGNLTKAMQKILINSIKTVSGLFYIFYKKFTEEENKNNEVNSENKKDKNEMEYEDDGKIFKETFCLDTCGGDKYNYEKTGGFKLPRCLRALVIDGDNSKALKIQGVLFRVTKADFKEIVQSRVYSNLSTKLKQNGGFDFDKISDREFVSFRLADGRASTDGTVRLRLFDNEGVNNLGGKYLFETKFIDPKNTDGFIKFFNHIFRKASEQQKLPYRYELKNYSPNSYSGIYLEKIYDKNNHLVGSVNIGEVGISAAVKKLSKIEETSAEADIINIDKELD